MRENQLSVLLCAAFRNIESIQIISISNLMLI
jgi:hypothetical protein